MFHFDLLLDANFYIQLFLLFLVILFVSVFLRLVSVALPNSLLYQPLLDLSCRLPKITYNSDNLS